MTPNDENALRRMFPSLVRRDREAVEDEAYHWLELREAGVIDADAPWPFGATFEPPRTARSTEEATDG